MLRLLLGESFNGLVHINFRKTHYEDAVLVSVYVGVFFCLSGSSVKSNEDGAANMVDVIIFP